MSWSLDSVTRLKRTEWLTDIQPLVEELSLIFSAFEFPTTGPGQVSPNPDGSNPITFPSFPDLNLPAIDFPSLLSGGLDTNPTDQTNTDDGNGTTTKTNNSWLRFSCPALLTSSGGDGSYVGTIYPQGTTRSTVNRSVLINALNNDTSLTVGSFVMAHALIQIAIATKTTKQNGVPVAVSTSVQVVYEVYYTQSSGGSGGGGTPGKIISGGPGSVYTVTIYPNGTQNDAQGNPPTTQDVTVTQLQLDPNETIPPGTWAIVTKVGGAYFMQVPVWL